MELGTAGFMAGNQGITILPGSARQKDGEDIRSFSQEAELTQPPGKPKEELA